MEPKSCVLSISCICISKCGLIQDSVHALCNPCSRWAFMSIDLHIINVSIQSEIYASWCYMAKRMLLLLHEELGKGALNHIMYAWLDRIRESKEKQRNEFKFVSLFEMYNNSISYTLILFQYVTFGNQASKSLLNNYYFRWHLLINWNLKGIFLQ